MIVIGWKYIIALLTTGAAVWGMQCKKMKYVILGQIIANTLLGLQYVIEGAFSAAVTIPPALALTIISFYYDAKNKPIPKNLIKAFIGIFAAVIVGQSVIEAVTGKAMLNAVALLLTNILVFSALVFFVLSITRKKSYQARICSGTNCFLWLIYDIILAPSAIITHGVILAFIIAGAIRLDRAEWRRMIACLRRGDVKNLFADGCDVIGLEADEDVIEYGEE